MVRNSASAAELRDLTAPKRSVVTMALPALVTTACLRAADELQLRGALLHLALQQLTRDALLVDVRCHGEPARPLPAYIMQ